jgi:hypothetical protein
MKSKVSYDRLREILTYIPDTGVWLWKDPPPRSKVNKGDLAGCISRNTKHPDNCYRRIKIDGRMYKAAILAWFWTYGVWPSKDLDHANGDSLDDRINNLREATDSQNRANSRVPMHNTSGFMGINWNKRNKRWHVRVMKEGYRHWVGAFKSLDEAKEAHRNKSIELLGEFSPYNREDRDEVG